MLKKASKFDINFLVKSIKDPTLVGNNYKKLCSTTKFHFKTNKYHIIIRKEENKGWFFKLINREMSYFYNFKHNYHNSDLLNINNNACEYYTDNVFDCIDLLFTGDFGIP